MIQLNGDRGAPNPEDALSLEVYYALLGPIKKYLDMPTVTNVHVNENGVLFIEEFGTGKHRVPETMPRPKRAALLSYLANLQRGRALDYLHSQLQCDLPVYGCRVQAFAPPIADWAVTIRVHAKTVIPLERYVERGELSEAHYNHLVEAIKEESNIVIAGSVNSGKTTFLNALLKKKAEFHADHRAVIVQDRREVNADGFDDRLYLMARVDQAHNEADGSIARYTYEFSDALESALRCSQDFLVWGEVRDGFSAFGLTMAMNTGTKGLMMTIHANSCLDALFRLEDLLRLNGKTPVRRMLVRVVDMMAFLERDRTTGHRSVSELARLHGVTDADHYDFTSL